MSGITKSISSSFSIIFLCEGSEVVVNKKCKKDSHNIDSGFSKLLESESMISFFS